MIGKVSQSSPLYSGPMFFIVSVSSWDSFWYITLHWDLITARGSRLTLTINILRWPWTPQISPQFIRYITLFPRRWSIIASVGAKPVYFETLTGLWGYNVKNTFNDADRVNTFSYVFLIVIASFKESTQVKTGIYIYIYIYIYMGSWDGNSSRLSAEIHTTWK